MIKPIYRAFALLLLLLGACQFIPQNPVEQTLVAQNQTLSAQITAVAATATAENDRMMVTLEGAQTAIRSINDRTDELAATLVARGTPAEAIDIVGIQPAAITITPPQLVSIPTQPAPQALEAQNAAPPPSDVQLTPNTSGQPADPDAPRLTNIVMADGVGADDCALQSSTTFSPDTAEIYVVATASQLTPQDVVSSRWQLNGENIAEYDWSPGFEIESACIWFYIDQSVTEFTPGAWSVELSLNGSTAATIPFTIAGAADAMEAAP